ncbi:MAG: oxidoreductase molybdopterin binding protein, partial [Acidimicrobiia bacterium]|nr:oxidoreductase molybdopterin binding protein [Acidimicrobiia bacterium]
MTLELPGPFRPGFFRSPLRGPWLTSVLGLVLLLSVPFMFVTGMLSYAAYNPRIRGNDITPDAGWLRVVFFDWPTHPSWLYQFTQGLHVTLGVVLVPVILAKLWSVIPKLFEFPPIRSLAHALERISLLLLVGGAVFEFVTGILNTQYWYPFPASFYTAHLYGAWIFMSAFVMHAALKIPVMRSALRSRSLRTELRTPTSATVAEPFHEGGL